VLSFDASRQFLATIGIQGQIVATPGHSGDSATLVLDDGAAFIGDLPHPMVEEEVTRRSWDKLRNLGAKTIYAGHVPPFPMPR
jgi:endoribonuclease LACTB2